VSAVIFDISMSLDGYIRAANPRPDEPLGEGGEALHAWAMDDAEAAGRDLLDRSVAGTGAMICGRTTYDDSIRWWQADGPSGSARLPLYVVSHTAPSDAPEGGVYTFVTTGIEDALAQAREAANGKNVAIMGGPAVGN
jgi:dihydrofolate reductase